MPNFKEKDIVVWKRHITNPVYPNPPLYVVIAIDYQLYTRSRYKLQRAYDDLSGFSAFLDIELVDREYELFEDKPSEADLSRC